VTSQTSLSLILLQISGKHPGMNERLPPQCEEEDAVHAGGGSGYQLSNPYANCMFNAVKRI
jgi:hypothetical protein